MGNTLVAVMACKGKMVMNAKAVMCGVILSLLLALILVVGEGVGLAETTPTVAVKETIDKVLTVLADQALKNPANQTERRVKLERIIGGRFDYEEMAKRTLPTQWKSLSTDQQKQFVALFQQFLTSSYVGNVEGYSGEQIEYGKERQKGTFAEVQTKVVSPKVQIPLDYRLINKGGEWRVYDVIIDGVSLMKNYRGQFSRIIDSSSFEALLDKLRNKTDLSASS
jgi:phospholipid transport system substrate-binding protein